MQIEVLNKEGKKVGSCELPEALFGQKPEPHFLHEVVTAYLANQRSGTHSTKTRGEVSGGGKKPWKQKHTGRARQGSNRSPIWRHGGITFGPKPHSYRQELTETKKRLALAQALSAKYSEGNIVVVDAFGVDKPKTAIMSAVLETLKGGRRPLLVNSAVDKAMKTAGKNIQGLHLCLAGDLNAYTVLNASRVIITKDATEKLAAILKQGKVAK